MGWLGRGQVRFGKQDGLQATASLQGGALVVKIGRCDEGESVTVRLVDSRGKVVGKEQRAKADRSGSAKVTLAHPGGSGYHVDIWGERHRNVVNLDVH